MNILVTGAKGFIGKNLIVELRNKGYEDIFEVDKETSEEELKSFVKNSHFIYHLAGVNRPKDEKDFEKGNSDFTKNLLGLLKDYDNTCPIVMSSSIQAELDNAYGKSKLMAEKSLLLHSENNNTDIYIYRLTNVFGKWSRPNYNTVVATYCHNISRDIDIIINDREADLKLVYIDDLVSEFIDVLENRNQSQNYFDIGLTYQMKLGQLADLIYSFKESRTSLMLPDMSNEIVKKLYSTYLSFLPEDKFSYELKMNSDDRGSFTEFIKSKSAGQVSVNVSKAGVVKGNHWHHTKNEKFMVVSGEGLIRFRKIDEDKIIEYVVSGEKIEVVDIPVGYTHSIVNTGESDLVTIMWVNECFDKEYPDTNFMEV